LFFLGTYLIVMSVSNGWIERSSVSRWYSLPERLVPMTVQSEAANVMCWMLTPDQSVGRCKDTTSTTQTPDLRCWAGGSELWCFDQAFAVATAVWLLLGATVFWLSCMKWGAVAPPLPQDAASRARRNDNWVGIIGQFLSAPFLLYSAYGILKTGPLDSTSSSACGVLSSCQHDIADRLPEAVAMGFAGLFLITTLVAQGYRTRNDFIYRPVYEEDEEK